MEIALNNNMEITLNIGYGKTVVFENTQDNYRNADEPIFRVPMKNGHILCVEPVAPEDENIEICIYTKDGQGDILQDIAIVRESKDSGIDVLVYGDRGDEDYTNKFTIPECLYGFTDDKEKMHDFYVLTKAEFLKSYSYLTEAEYDKTAEEIRAEIVIDCNRINELLDDPSILPEFDGRVLLLRVKDACEDISLYAYAYGVDNSLGIMAVRGRDSRIYRLEDYEPGLFENGAQLFDYIMESAVEGELAP